MNSHAPVTYAIRVSGQLDDHWSATLASLALARREDGTTSLTGPLVDQAQLDTGQRGAHGAGRRVGAAQRARHDRRCLGQPVALVHRDAGDPRELLDDRRLERG